MRNCISVLRASTNKVKQANSIQVQREIIESFALQHGYNIQEEYVEYVSGTIDARPAFNDALQRAEDTGCYVLFYRADRMARSMTVWNRINHLLPQIRLCELGDVEPNLFVLSILIAQATQESKNISTRVKAAYKTIKKNNPNHDWGNPNLTEASIKGRETVARKAKEFNQRIISVVKDLQHAGYTKTQDLVDRLNEIGILTRRDKPWTYQNLYRLMRMQ